MSRAYADVWRSSAWHRDRAGRYPVIVKGDGPRLRDADGNLYFDFLSGGAMVCSFGHGDIPSIRAAMNGQATAISYLYGDIATSPAREELARAVADLAPAGLSRVWFTSGGSEANEAMMRAVLSYWAARGQPSRHLIVGSGVQYNGATFGTLGLAAGRPGLRAPYDPYIRVQASIPPCDPETDPDGRQSLAVLDRLCASGNVGAVLLEPVSGMSYPGYSPPAAFWEGLEERRAGHGFLLCLDEIVTSFGRCGSWFAASQLPVRPDIITFGKGLGAGFMPIGGMVATEDVYQAVTWAGPFDHGHTWDAAPLTCAAGLAVVQHLKDHGLVESVASRGVHLRAGLTAALARYPVVREVRGHGFLLGVPYTDPHAAQRVDAAALDLGLLIRSNNPGVHGAGAQSTIAPCFTATDDDLTQMTELLAAAVGRL